MNKVILLTLGVVAVSCILVHAQFGGAGFGGGAGAGAGAGYGGGSWGGHGQQRGYVLQDYLRALNANNQVRLQNARLKPDRFNFVSPILGAMFYFLLRRYQTNATDATIAG